MSVRAGEQIGAVTPQQGEPQINQLGTVRGQTAGQVDVVRAQGAVHLAGPMQVLERFAQRDGHPDDVLRLRRAVRRQRGGQRLAFHRLADHEGPLVGGLTEVSSPDQPGVSQ